MGRNGSKIIKFASIKNTMEISKLFPISISSIKIFFTDNFVILQKEDILDLWSIKRVIHRNWQQNWGFRGKVEIKNPYSEGSKLLPSCNIYTKNMVKKRKLEYVFNFES